MGTKLSISCAESPTARVRALGYLVLACWLSATAQQLKAPIIVKSSFNGNGQNYLCDSFNSSDPSKSVYGKYSSNVAGDNGGIICTFNIVGEISIGNGHVYGTVSTGPNGTATIGSSGGIGSHTWQTSNTGIEPANSATDPDRVWYRHDANVSFSLVTIPYTDGLAPEGPADVAIATQNVSSNYVMGGSAYPNPPPVTGVSTNVVGTNFVTSYPGPISGLVTNLVWVTNSCPNYPTNYIGSVVTNFQTVVSSSPPTNGCFLNLYPSGPNRWSYTLIVSYAFKQIGGYSYPIYTYNYAVFGTNVVYQTNHYDHVLNSGDYYSDAALSGNTVVLGNARLALMNGLMMSGLDSMTIASGGSLTLYAHGSTCFVGGAGIFNLAGKARNFVLFHDGLSLTVNQSTRDFIGVIVAPNADVMINPVGSGSFDFEGAIMARSVTLNAPWRIHFDEDLTSFVLPGSAIPPAGWISNPQITDSGFQFVVNGVANERYAVEGSTNLIDWGRLLTNVVPFHLTWLLPSPQDRMFFRAVWIP